MPRCNIQLCESEDEEIEEEKEDSKEVKKDKKTVSIGELPEGFNRENRRVTRSMTEEERQELERDQIANFWMKLDNNECFDDISVYIVEVPVREHKTPEVIEVKDNEIKNLEKYGVFEEVKYEGQETVGSRWVITKKEKADGRKKNVKGRLVAKGF